MKRTIIAVALLLAVAAASAAQFFYVSAQADSFLERIEALDKAMRKNDFGSALKECKSLSSAWDDASGTIDVLLIHDYVDNIGISISQMQAHIENFCPDMYFAESEYAKKGLASIKRSEYPNFENIL